MQLNGFHVLVLRFMLLIMTDVVKHQHTRPAAPGYEQDPEYLAHVAENQAAQTLLADMQRILKSRMV